ncbi:MAG TPA: histidine phosphatase family protein [Acidimicrobiia bacterium]|nr:histidine phosphatase family protein [Acidimicrobiia bacterium]
MIVFVRHGQTAVNREGRFQGRLDPPLTELGLEQARLVAKSLVGCGADLVLTSPLQRASDTARAIAEAVGIAVEVDERLVEVDYGDWDGQPLGSVSRAQWARWRDDAAFAPPGGESLIAVGERVARFCTDRLRADSFVVAVSHVSPIKAAVAWALGSDTDATWRMHLDVASVTRLDRRGDGPPLLLTYNETSHLRA